MSRIETWLLRLTCIMCIAVLAGCGFHLRRSAALPAVMQQQVYLQISGGGEFTRSLAGALRAAKVDVLDTSTTGVATLSRELNTKRLELLHEALPTARRIAVLVDPSAPGTAAGASP